MLAPVIPRHVAACQHSPIDRERWSVWTWSRDGSTKKQVRVPYSCNSWRCEVCRRHEAAVTFARIGEAAAPLDPNGWCFFVLTLDREAHYGGERWTDVNDAYRSLGKMTTAFLTRIGRRWGADSKIVGKKRLRVVRRLGKTWVAVVEAHRSGWPHVNLLVWAPELADAVELARDAWKRKESVPRAVRELARKATLLGGELLSDATEAGWGRQSTAEAARDAGSVAGYLVKLAGLHDASVGELAKITQVPLAAPARFRRLRAGKGFLPPRHSDPSVTGCLVRRRRSREGDWEIQPINPPKDERHLEPIARARRAELALVDEEERLLSRNKGKLPPLPPLRVAVGGLLETHHETTERRWAASVRAQQQCA